MNSFHGFIHVKRVFLGQLNLFTVSYVSRDIRTDGFRRNQPPPVRHQVAQNDTGLNVTARLKLQ